MDKGLPYALKEPDSLKRKVATALVAAPGESMTTILGDIKDSVRYTAEIPGASYAQGVTKITGDLRSAGFEQVGVLKNSWGGTGYQGINSFWRDPATGHTFELQFHTPESFNAKMVTHDLYNEARLPSTTADARAELNRQQGEVFSQVPLPPGATNVH
jgi:hypothetical protein